MQIRTLQKLFLIIIFFPFLATTANAQNTGTLKDKNGQIMRGYPMIIGKQYEDRSTAFALDPNNWQTLKDSARNTVRLCWIGPWLEDRYGKEGFDWVEEIWDMDKVAQVMDSCVAIATDKQMNVVINYHNVSEQQNPNGFVSQEDVNMERLSEFWVKMAPRYKDNDLVYYEISNEPIWKGSSNSGYRDPDFMTNFIGVYDTVRALAPERHILMFSTNSMKYDFQGIMEAYDPYLDWDYTSVAYHMYSTPSSSSVVELAKTYRVICTEWGYPSFNQPYVVEVDGNEICAQSLEGIGHSWIDWHNWGDATFDVTFNELNPDAREKGYAWWVKTGVNDLFVERPRVYPNPTKGLVKLSKVSNYKVFNMSGSMVSQGEAESIDLSNVENGLYMIVIEGSQVEKIIKQ